MKYKVEVWLKDSIEDPEGVAIKKALDLLGFHSIKNVRVGKVYLIEIDENDKRAVDSICEKLLINPVVHKFEIHKV